eukprot:SAG11_NODE_34482_length_271_cov_2.093023_1_plen_52_part_01
MALVAGAQLVMYARKFWLLQHPCWLRVADATRRVINIYVRLAAAKGHRIEGH